MSDVIPYSFEDGFHEWSRVPVDEFSYLYADEILVLHPLQLIELVRYAMGHRWSPFAWRNKERKLEAFMDSISTKDKVVMDFGCGFGFDALRFAACGAQVVLADLHPRLLLAAQRVISLLIGRFIDKLVIVSPQSPFMILRYKIDLFWSLGVLHHFPYMSDILRRACDLLNPGGECRIVVHSDNFWKELMNEPVPQEPTHLHPRFKEFVRKLDPVGNYVDWYDHDKLVRSVEGFGQVVRSEYLCDGKMIGAVIRPLPQSSLPLLTV